MGKIEEIEKNQETKSAALEQDTEMVEKNIEDLDKKIEELERAISAVSDDDQVRASLERNLAEREQEKQQEQQKGKDLENQIEDLFEELNEYENINNNSKSEVSQLQSVEDVGDAMAVIEQRESWINARRDTLNELKNRLSKLG